MKVRVAMQGLTELKLSEDGKLVLVRPEGEEITEYAWDEITDLECFENRITSIPPLPRGLVRLDLTYNLLQVLPLLPGGLKYLLCGENCLKALPPLPEGLDQLQCDQNQLKTLPIMPACLEILECSGNQLRTLPAIPNLKFFRCKDNPFDQGVSRDLIPQRLIRKVPESAFATHDLLRVQVLKALLGVLGGATSKPFG